MPSTRAAAATGTLMRNVEPHQKFSTSQPPSTMPRALPPPATPLQIAMARARSPFGNELTRIDSVAGMTSAPPMPITARVTISDAPESTKSVP